MRISTLLNPIRRSSSVLVKLLLITNATAFLINAFVGLMVYGNPLVPLTDSNNLLHLAVLGIALSLGLFTCYLLIAAIERAQDARKETDRAAQSERRISFFPHFFVRNRTSGQAY